MSKNKIHKSNDQRRQILSLADKLAEMLYQTPEYHQFLSAKSELEADEEQVQLLAQLRQQQMSLRMAALMGEECDDDTHECNNMYLLLAQDPVVNNYLFAEGRFLRLISDIEAVFSDKLGLYMLTDDVQGDMTPAYNMLLN